MTAQAFSMAQDHLLPASKDRKKCRVITAYPVYPVNVFHSAGEPFTRMHSAYLFAWKAGYTIE